MFFLRKLQEKSDPFIKIYLYTCYISLFIIITTIILSATLPKKSPAQLYIKNTLEIFDKDYSNLNRIAPEKADILGEKISLNCFKNERDLFLIFTNLPKSSMARSVRMDLPFVESVKDKLFDKFDSTELAFCSYIGNCSSFRKPMYHMERYTSALEEPFLEQIRASFLFEFQKPKFGDACADNGNCSSEKLYNGRSRTAVAKRLNLSDKVKRFKDMPIWYIADAYNNQTTFKALFDLAPCFE